ncbi:methyltransferase domain-containing protein [Candidatus Pseudothioglobus singularis]|nr:methyltransferase domain-containing protein [Candidatus Pseudothioglobus singularis]MDB4598575.1 methyltransferase domain-containing protein [Candidatus Pseudothioglobus singularis]|tara:strand:+ start:696 stop:1289 length:594 start_codon:yes stop_codon:yes gene_type:complete
MKTFLHVGCGPNYKDKIKGFNNERWKEIRFDIDETVNPDIIGTLTDMHSVETGSMDAVYSSHNIEHIYPHEVPIALKEFYRVLKDDGIVVLTCPDLQRVCEAVVNDKLTETLYKTSGGYPISPIDILYGWRGPLKKGNHYMAHKTGFTYSVLNNELLQAGFKMNYGGQVQDWNLFVVSFKQNLSEEQIKKRANPFLP